MPAGQIFISYRRDDAAGYARAVGDELGRQFGAERVFIDVDDIGAGLAFDRVIDAAIGRSNVLLVLIGRRWAGEREGRPARIAEPDDRVRHEVAAGLAAGMRVIPLLLDGCPMPTAAQLPPPLQALASRQALALDGSRFAADIARLVAALREALGERATPPPASRRAAFAWVAAGLLPLGGWWLWRQMAPRDRRAQINGDWSADVVYDWPGARYRESFAFAGEGVELSGSASFLGVRRGLEDGQALPDGLRFVTRSSEWTGEGRSSQTVHRYRGRLVGDALHFVMQTEGSATPHQPVEFIARRPPR